MYTSFFRRSKSSERSCRNRRWQGKYLYLIKYHRLWNSTITYSQRSACWPFRSNRHFNVNRDVVFFIPHATSCGGYNAFDPSVSQSFNQSVSPVFLVSATPLKPLYRISWNFVVVKDIPCWCAYPQEMLIWSLYLFWTLA